MSSRKTEHFGLHAWEPGDSVLRSEFNENFAALDGAARVAAGSFIGDGAGERYIELGFKPAAVLLMCRNGCVGQSITSGYGGLAMQGLPCMADSYENGELFRLDEGGFFVHCYSTRPHGYSVYSNISGVGYYYLAVRE